MKQAKKQ
jgi:hypothetical protein